MKFITGKVLDLLLYSFIIWYMLVNFLPLSATSIFELQEHLATKRNLGDLQSLIQLCSGFAVNLFFNVSLLMIVIFMLMRNSKITKTHRLYSLKVGMNYKWKIWLILYYSIYFGIWFVVILLIGLSPVVSSLYLWAVLVGIQAIFVLLNIFKLMKDCFSQIINLFIEIYLLTVFSFCLAFQLIKNPSEQDLLFN